jgi:hypothetical protein
MNRSFVAAALVCCAVLAAGCEPAICSQFKDTAATLKTKADPCTTLGAGFTIPQPTDAQIKSCDNNQSTACTDADRTKATNYQNCVNKLANCSTATAAQWSADLLACSGELTGLSTSCLALFQ